MFAAEEIRELGEGEGGEEGKGRTAKQKFWQRPRLCSIILINITSRAVPNSRFYYSAE